MINLARLEKILGVEFKDEDILTQALTHRSYINENPDFHLSHNERMEFLGDAVLELIVTDFLFSQYPEKAEGELTSWRAALVNAKMLSSLAKEIGLNDFLLLSKGESRETGKARDYILANAFEALVGAMYLDPGYKKTEAFIKKCLLPKLPSIIEGELFRDAKSTLQEVAQEKEGITPSYKVLKEWGPDHAKQFIVGVFLGKKKVGEGEGSSKQEAEVQAAQDALKTINNS
ncbi:MAG: ribonuclease III [bacterium]|nr:ribonuclease III [bacterium]